MSMVRSIAAGGLPLIFFFRLCYLETGGGDKQSSEFRGRKGQRPCIGVWGFPNKHFVSVSATPEMTKIRKCVHTSYACYSSTLYLNSVGHPLFVLKKRRKKTAVNVPIYNSLLSAIQLNGHNCPPILYQTF